MSIKVMTKVWEGYPGGGSELLALLALADWSDDAGRCWPSIASVARKIRLSEKQTGRQIHSIIESGRTLLTVNLIKIFMTGVWTHAILVHSFWLNMEQK